MRRQGARSIAMLLGAILLFGLGSTAHALSTTIGGAGCGADGLGSLEPIVRDVVA